MPDQDHEHAIGRPRTLRDLPEHLEDVGPRRTVGDHRRIRLDPLTEVDHVVGGESMVLDERRVDLGRLRVEALAELRRAAEADDDHGVRSGLGCYRLTADGYE